MEAVVAILQVLYCPRTLNKNIEFAEALGLYSQQQDASGSYMIAACERRHFCDKQQLNDKHNNNCAD